MTARSGRGAGTVVGVLCAAGLLCGAAATSVALAVDLVQVTQERAAFVPPTEGEVQDRTLPPSVFGRADAEVLDVDRDAPYTSMDVLYVSAGRTQNVARVEITHLGDPPEPGDVVPIAYDPHATDIVFDLDDPGLSDPQGNGYLAWAPPPPPRPAVDHVRVRVGVAAALVAAGGGVLVVSVHRAGRPAPRPGGLTPPAGP